MSSKTSIKSKFIGFILTAALIAGAFVFFQGFGHPNGKPERSRVLLSVTFTPEVRDFNIWVQVSVAGVLAIEDRTKHSPWERAIDVTPGASIRLVAVQYRTGVLNCTIAPSSGRVNTNAIDFPGELHCVTVA